MWLMMRGIDVWLHTYGSGDDWPRDAQKDRGFAENMFARAA